VQKRPKDYPERAIRSIITCISEEKSAYLLNPELIRHKL